MPSLRQKVTTYFRQLSFIADPREGNRPNLNVKKPDDGNFIIKFLEGRMESVFTPGPDIYHGQNPSDLPDLPMGFYPTGPQTVTAACTGPEEGLTGVRRSKLHLSAGSDIDFIDTSQEQELEIRRSTSNHKHKFNSQKYRSDQNANKTNIRSRKNSIEGKIDKYENNGGNTNNVVVNVIQTKSITIGESTNAKTDFNESKSTSKFSQSIDLSNHKDEKKDLAAIDTKYDKDNSVQDENIRKQNSGVNIDPIAGVQNWKMESEHVYGISISLYENNILINEPMGHPIADCYGLVARGSSAAMALADGVNWGDGARLAARSAVQGCLDYLDTAIFGIAQECMATTTRDVFVSLLRSLWEAHSCILEVGGALSTLTVAVVLPLNGQYRGKYAVCSCNVGDSLGYVYSKKHGVREFTQGSHDITSMRDMRDALGALGPVDGNKPELSNLTLSMTTVEPGDIVFLTSDGISDNFDPVVGKFAEAWSPNSKPVKIIEPQLAPKRQNKSSSAVYSGRTARESVTLESNMRCKHHPSAGSSNTTPIRPQAVKSVKSTNNQLTKSSTNSAVSTRPKYVRSHTVIEPRVSIPKSPIIKYSRSASGLPLVTASQRHALTLLRLEDLLSYGINGTLRPCPSARQLCHLLVDFAKMITSARRKTLEQRELFYKIATGPDGIKKEIELTRMQHRAARKRIVDSSAFAALPGKLDHASVVAFTVGSGLQTTEFKETDF